MLKAFCWQLFDLQFESYPARFLWCSSCGLPSRARSCLAPLHHPGSRHPGRTMADSLYCAGRSIVVETELILWCDGWCPTAWCAALVEARSIQEHRTRSAHSITPTTVTCRGCHCLPSLAMLLSRRPAPACAGVGLCSSNLTGPFPAENEKYWNERRPRFIRLIKTTKDSESNQAWVYL